MSAVWKSVAVVLTLTSAAFAASAAVPTSASRAAVDPVLEALIADVLERNPAQERSLPDPLIAIALAEANDPWTSSPGARDVAGPALLWSQELRARLGLRSATARAYYGMLLARERLELVREQADLWKRIEGVSRARYAVGQGAQQDVLRVQVEVTRTEELRARQEAEAEIRQAEINRLRERPLDTPIETTARLGLSASGNEEAGPLWERLRASNPEMGAMRVVLQQARLAVRLAQQAPKPDATPRPRSMKRHKSRDEPGMRLPLQDKGGVAHAEVRLRATERRAEDIEMQLRYRTHERLTQLRTLERVARIYDQGIIPQDRMSLEAALANYQAGKVPFVAVLDALATLYGDRSTYLGLLNDHAVMRVRLEEARLDSGASMGGLTHEPAGHAPDPGGMGMAGPLSGK